VIELSINGETRQFPAPLNCADLVTQLDLSGKRIAIEHNGEIVPKSQYLQTELQSGDQLEVVVAVGGG
jgi:sulfur carrier protein